MLAGLGDTVTKTVTVTITVADLVLSACDTAFTVTPAVGVGTVAGAMYAPVLDIVPQAAAAQLGPETDQVRAVFVVPVTDATNCRGVPTATLFAEDTIETATGGGGGELEPPPQANRNTTGTSPKRRRILRRRITASGNLRD